MRAKRAPKASVSLAIFPDIESSTRTPAQLACRRSVAYYILAALADTGVRAPFTIGKDRFYKTYGHAPRTLDTALRWYTETIRWVEVVDPDRGLYQLSDIGLSVWFGQPARRRAEDNRTPDMFDAVEAAPTAARPPSPASQVWSHYAEAARAQHYAPGLPKEADDDGVNAFQRINGILSDVRRMIDPTRATEPDVARDAVAIVCAAIDRAFEARPSDKTLRAILLDARPHIRINDTQPPHNPGHPDDALADDGDELADYLGAK